MANEIKEIRKDLIDMKKDIEFIKHAVSEDFELSASAKKALKEARARPKSKYVNLNDI